MNYYTLHFYEHVCMQQLSYCCTHYMYPHLLHDITCKIKIKKWNGYIMQDFNAIQVLNVKLLGFFWQMCKVNWCLEMILIPNLNSLNKWRNVFSLNFFYRITIFNSILEIEMIIFISHMAHDKWALWLTNFENNYQNDQNICERYLSFKHVLIYNLSFALLCTTSDDQLFLFLLMFSYIYVNVKFNFN
jgi:hypothetical protein